MNAPSTTAARIAATHSTVLRMAPSSYPAALRSGNAVLKHAQHFARGAIERAGRPEVIGYGAERSAHRLATRRAVEEARSIAIDFDSPVLQACATLALGELQIAEGAWIEASESLEKQVA